MGASLIGSPGGKIIPFEDARHFGRYALNIVCRFFKTYKNCYVLIKQIKKFLTWGLMCFYTTTLSGPSVKGSSANARVQQGFKGDDKERGLAH